MIFMHNETGHIFELLILSLDDSNNEIYSLDQRPAYRVGEFTLMGMEAITKRGLTSEFRKEFTFIGFV